MGAKSFFIIKLPFTEFYTIHYTLYGR